MKMKEGLFTVLLAQLSLSNSFVLDSTSPSLPTAHNVEQLLDLLLDEKRSRTTLELAVNSLKYELAAQNNKTGTEIERVKTSLIKETSNRRQLEQEYTRLSIEFCNLSMDHKELMLRNKELEDKVHNLTQEIGLDQSRLSSVENKANAMNQSLLLSLSTNTVDITAHYADLLLLKQKQGYKAGFTVQHPSDGPSPGTITFTSIISNIGDQFNSTTGNFTCVYPGVYLFTLSVYQASNSIRTSCYIRFNGVKSIYVPAVSSSLGSFSQASNSVIFQMKTRDTVDLGDCTDANTMLSYTTFSGILISTD